MNEAPGSNGGADDGAEAARPAFPTSPRVDGLAALELTPRRLEVRRVARVMREIIEHLTSSSATTEELATAADDLEGVATLLRSLPGGQAYLGFAEAAMAGDVMDPNDPERWAIFDHSPLIGLANPMSPPMRIGYEGDRVVCEVTFGSAYEGPPGCVHGGYVAAAFDELLGVAQSMSGTQGMTAHLGVDYRRPTPLHTPLVMEGWFDRREGRKIWARGTIVAEGELRAEAEGLFIAFDPGRFAALLAARGT